MKILIIAAHGDDCELMFGGIVHNLVSAGNTIEYLITTDSSGWVSPSVMSVIERESIFSIRKKEQEQAAAILGVKKVHYLGLSDGSPYSQNINELLLDKIREVSPEYILTHSDKEFHSDHVTVVNAVRMLCNYIDEPPKIINQFLLSKHKFIGKFRGVFQQARIDELSEAETRFFILSEENITKKVAALSCYYSQIVDMENLSERVWIEARFLGHLAGVQFAETIKAVPVNRYKTIKNLEEST